MAQAQVTEVEVEVNHSIHEVYEGLLNIKLSPSHREIRCVFGESYKLKVKANKNSDIIVTVKKGSRTLTFRLEDFEVLCDLKIAVKFLASFLEGRSVSIL